MPSRRRLFPIPFALMPWMAPRFAAAAGDDVDPYASAAWPDLMREVLGTQRVRFDARVQVRIPPFAEDPMNVPVSVSVVGLEQVEQITVLVDRNPIRKVLDYFPLAAAPSLALRFKLEQASPVRAAVRLRDGAWHVGGAWVDSSGGGCSVPGTTRGDGSWAQTLGQVSGRVFRGGGVDASSFFRGARVRVRVMHPMDTGLAAGIPALYINRLALRDAQERELLRMNCHEPVSENPVFSFDFDAPPTGPLRLVGSDNNGNRIDGRIG